MTMWVSYLTICLYCFTRILDFTRKYKRINFVHSQMYHRNISLVHMFHIYLQKSTNMAIYNLLCFKGMLQFFFILIVIQNAFKTNQKCSINSAIISVKVHINYLFNNKSLSLFLTYWKGVLSICNGINVNIFISECKL